MVITILHDAGLSRRDFDPIPQDRNYSRDAQDVSAKLIWARRQRLP